MKRRIISIVIGIAIIAFLCEDNMSSFYEKAKEAMTGSVSDSKTVDPADKEYHNIWITDSDDNEIKGVSKDGEYITFNVSEDAGFEMGSEDLIADITVEDGYVSKIRMKRDMVDDNSARYVTDEKGTAIESSVYGRIATSDDFSSINIYNAKENETKIVFEDMYACAMVKFFTDNEKDDSDNANTKNGDNENDSNTNSNNDENDDEHKTKDVMVSVLLSDTKKRSLSIKADKQLKITDKNRKELLFSGKKIKITSGDNITLTNEKDKEKKLAKGTQIRVIPSSDTAMVNSTKYSGEFLISNTDSSLAVTNILPLEDYVAGVVKAEMPESFDTEALKTQSVCARTFAVEHMMPDEKTLKDYDADLDDTVSYQVYKGADVSDKIKNAVNSTKGQILTYDDKPAKTYFFSTSCGYTSDCKDVFGSDVPYLLGALQTKENYFEKEVFQMDMPDTGEAYDTVGMQFSEKSFAKFLKTESKCIEKDSPWFKWNADITSKVIAANLTSMGYGQINNIKSIKIAKRESGGIVNEIDINTNIGNITISGQYTIRKALAPGTCKIVKNDKSSVTGHTLLPSAYFVVSAKNSTYHITGGGFGHGTGLSQYGADALAKKGLGYKDILNHYYFGTDIKNVSFCLSDTQ